MSLFDVFKNKPQIKGNIGYFNLTEWWINTFSDEERNYIVNKYNNPDLVHTNMNNVVSTSLTAANMLNSLSSYFATKKDINICLRILKKAEELGKDNDLYFTYSHIAEALYKLRDIDDTAIDKTIKYCHKQIEISSHAIRHFNKEMGFLPVHSGYKRLIIIKTKQKEYSEALRLAKEARDQGWGGEWDKTIAKCEKELSK